MKLINYFLLMLIFTSKIYAAPSPDYLEFNHLFSHWTKAFNQKDLKTSCNLFSKSVTADYRGFPQKNYSSICDGFKKIFQEHDKIYHYDFDLKQVYRSGDLSAARITWYLSIYSNGKLISKTQDEGLDVLVKNKEGQWQIVNYLGYPK